jgi:hypothetical protein
MAPGLYDDVLDEIPPGSKRGSGHLSRTHKRAASASTEMFGEPSQKVCITFLCMPLSSNNFLENSAVS